MPCLGTVLLWVLFHWWRSPDRQLFAAIERAPAVPSDRVLEREPARVVGELYPETELRAPLSDEPCAAWCVRVEERDLLGLWMPLIDVSECAPLVLRDGDRTLRVSSGEVRLLPWSRDWSGTAFTIEPPPGLVRLLERHGAPSDGYLRWCEGRLEPGARAVVVGVGARDPDGAVRLIAGPEGLLISDDPRLAA